MAKRSLGIITYHAAYNFGSALQAFATQEAVRKLGYDVSILNYRPNEQKKYYNKLYRTDYGIKIFIKDLLLMPYAKERKIRADLFEQFFKKYFNLTKEANTPEDVDELYKMYDIIISGSDQIWNKHSNELYNVGWEYMMPYLLNGYEGKKISYASSPANMTSEDLQKILSYILDFDFVSVREKGMCDLLRNMGVDAVSVPDPTFLLKKEEWASLLNLKNISGERYILYYSLAGTRTQNTRKEALRALAKKYNCIIKCVTPFASLKNETGIFENHYEYGPVEFLQAVMNSQMVVTDSYHGTILSINFEKPFYSISKKEGSELRKIDVLNYLGFHDCIVQSIDEILNKCSFEKDYSKLKKKTEEFQKQGYDYMAEALGK